MIEKTELKNMRTLLFILLLISLSITSAAFAASFKCWTNDDGIRECGNAIPPKYIKQKIEYHNTKSGKLQRIKSAAKTEAELAAEKNLKKEQEKNLREAKKQEAYDDVLLKTYLTVDDLLLSLQWKITTLDSRIKVSENSIQSQDSIFKNYTKKAANIERSGKPLPKGLKDQIASNRNKVKKLQDRIKTLENEKKEIHKKFSHDTDRFTTRKVKNLTMTLASLEKSRQLNSIQVKCSDKKNCHNMWQKAIKFTRKNSDLPVIFDTKAVYTTVSPKAENDIALIISRVENKVNNQVKGEKITLQARCYPSRKGESLCKSDIISELLTRFSKQMKM